MHLIEDSARTEHELRWANLWKPFQAIDWHREIDGLAKRTAFVKTDRIETNQRPFTDLVSSKQPLEQG